MGAQFLGNQTGGCGYTGLARLISGGVLRLMRLDFLSLRQIRSETVQILKEYPIKTWFLRLVTSMLAITLVAALTGCASIGTQVAPLGPG